jgi:hypothetical protein
VGISRHDAALDKPLQDERKDPLSDVSAFPMFREFQATVHTDKERDVVGRQIFEFLCRRMQQRRLSKLAPPYTRAGPRVLASSTASPSLPKRISGGAGRRVSPA